MTAVDHEQTRNWARVEVGTALPPLYDRIDFTRAAAAPAATMDYFQLHHDPSWARANGSPDIVMSTIQLLGFVDRYATQWSGPGARVIRRKVRLAQSVHPGDTLIAEGRVVGKRCDDTSARHHYLIDLDVVVCNQHGKPCCPSELTLEFSAPQSSAEVR